jgi:tetratricopeptide (TPR) repeat protein
MRDTAKTSFFIGGLIGCDRRQSLPGAITVIPHISAAAFVDAAAASNHRKLAELIQLGEHAQALRSAEGLLRAGQSILDLPLRRVAYCIGRYYLALSLNRQGPQAFSESNTILVDVADHGPLLFRAKARVALATNLRSTGDDKTALDLYAEAVRIAESCEGGKFSPLFLAALQSAFIKYDEGDCRGALADIEKLEPLAKQIGLVLPASLHNYYNSLAAFLTASGRVEEASGLRGVLLTSPFRNAYPEWQRTCADLDHRTRPPSRSSVLIGEPFTDDPEAVRASVSSGADQGAIEFELLSALLKDAVGVLPESSTESLSEAGRLHHTTTVDAQPRLADSPFPHGSGTAIAAAALISTTRVRPAADRTIRTVEIAAALLPLKTVPRHQQCWRISDGPFSGRLPRRLCFATRMRGLCPSNTSARLRPLRWSYLKIHHAYPRPPNPANHFDSRAKP